MNLRRSTVRWKNEVSFLSPVPAFGAWAMYKFSSAATLVGLETPAESKNLELKPYVASSVTTDRVGGDVGLDVKYGLTQSLIADFTYNTDFAQVEQDQQQINLTRLSLFFPEKREFFLEGQGSLPLRPGAGR